MICGIPKPITGMQLVRRPSACRPCPAGRRTVAVSSKPERSSAGWPTPDVSPSQQQNDQPPSVDVSAALGLKREQPAIEPEQGRSWSEDATSGSPMQTPLIRGPPSFSRNRLSASTGLGPSAWSSTTNPNASSSSPASTMGRPGPSGSEMRFGSSSSSTSTEDRGQGRSDPRDLMRDERMFRGETSSTSSSSWNAPDRVLQPKRSAGQAGPNFSDETVTLPMQGFLELRSQEDELATTARAVALPPVQSVLELTSASQPPTKSLEGATEGATATAGRQLADGQGELADGTRWSKKSGQEYGANGFWKRWTLLQGSNKEGTATWEECWWEVSDWIGLKELGATKSGNTETGAAWRETWTEKATTDKATLEITIDRTAHKWARADGREGTDEWEEKWGERHKSFDSTNKWADKWGRDGPNVWHEKWGEDYDGRGACTKWTDKWAETLLPEGGRQAWGDKWTEQFGHGKGMKHGEVWNTGAEGERYNRWWNEHHLGEGFVRKWGDSTTGEFWDATEEMETVYNPVPHFGFDLAAAHSPHLWRVPVLKEVMPSTQDWSQGMAMSEEPPEAKDSYTPSVYSDITPESSEAVLYTSDALSLPSAELWARAAQEAEDKEFANAVLQAAARQRRRRQQLQQREGDA